MRRVLLALSAILLSLNGEIWAKEDLLTPGMEVRASAGAGLHFSRGAASLLHNPANLAKNPGHELYGELSLSFLRYQYAPTSGNDTAKLEAVVPPLFLGGSLALPLNLKVGVGFAPRGTGMKNEIKNLPLVVEGEEIFVRAEQKDASLRGVAGVAVKLLESFHLGLGMTVDVDRETFYLYGDLDRPTLVIDNKGVFGRYQGGLQWQIIDSFGVALAYFSPLEKPYQGSISVVDNLAKKATTAHHYFPATYKIGFLLRGSTWQGGMDYSYKNFQQGRKKRRVGLSAFDGRERDLVNTHNLSLGVGRTLGKVIYRGGIGWQGGAVGKGSLRQADGKVEVDVSGIQMNADFDYLDRLTIGLGRFKKSKGGQLGYFASYVLGFKEVPNFAPNGGSYRFHMLYIGVGRRLALGL